MKMKDVKRPVREALQQLEQKKMLESSYAEVNKYQSLINLFANLQRACELMADEIGSHTVMSAQVGIAGSTKVGEWCMFGGQVGIAGHATIADKTMAGAQAGIPNSVKKPGTAVQGTPAIDAKTFWKSSAIFKNLYQMWADMNEVKKEIKALKDELAAKK